MSYTESKENLNLH